MQLKINETNLIRNLEKAFAGADSFVQELAQNARRAGATEIDIIYEPEKAYFSIADNGCGIDDFSKLFDVATSGWDSESALNENPYGLGFLSVLYQCESIDIYSKGKVLSCKCEDILSFKDLSDFISEKEDDGITRISLFCIKDKSLKLSMEEIFCGFELPVRVNDKLLERKYALSHIEAVDLEGGMMSKCSADSVRNRCSYEYIIFYQGFVVERTYPRHQRYINPVVVHLDISRFDAVLPDRKSLIDHKEAIENISLVYEEYCRSLLVADFVNLSKSELSANFNLYCSYGLKSMYNDIDILPTGTLTVPVYYPIYSDNHEGEGFSFGSYLQYENVYDRKRLEEDNITVLYNENLEFDVEEGFILEMYLYQLGEKVLLIDRKAYGEGHWVHEIAKSVSADALALELGVIKSVESHVWSEYAAAAIIVDSYFIDGPLGKVEINSPSHLRFDKAAEGYDLLSKALNSDSDNIGAFVIPFNANYCDDEILLQDHCFQEEYHYNVDYKASQQDAYSKWYFGIVFRDDPSAHISYLLNKKLPKEYWGKGFSLSVGKDGSIANVSFS